MQFDSIFRQKRRCWNRRGGKGFEAMEFFLEVLRSGYLLSVKI